MNVSRCKAFMKTKPNPNAEIEFTEGNKGHEGKWLPARRGNRGVAQICKLPYRGIAFCGSSPDSRTLESSEPLPIANR